MSVIVGRTGLSRVMVGRADELGQLRRLLAGVADPQVALVSGDAGVGKTRLVHEFLAGLPAGVPVLRAEADEGAAARPYRLLVEAVEPFVGGWTAVPEPLAAVEDGLRLLLVPVGAELAPAPDRPYEPEELRRAAVALLSYLAGPGPAAMVFEDLQWADAESLSLFVRLATAPRLPLLLIGTYRSEGLGRRDLVGLLATLERRRSVEHVPLRALAPSEVAELLAGMYGRAVPFRAVDAVHRRTGGNPFFIEELVSVAGSSPPEDLASLSLPVSLSEAVLRHLDGLDAEARRVLDAAAVLGQRLSFDHLACVTGLDEDRLVGVLRVLVGRGLVVEEEPEVISFRHALTREAVADRLLGRERRRLHERALRALREAGSDDWSALAHHAVASGHWDEVVSAARQGAAAYLRGGSTLEALRLAELGLREAGADLKLLELAAQAAWSVGLRASAVDHGERWRSLAELSGDARARVGALRLLARLRWESGDQKGHRAMVEEALSVAEDLGPSIELVLAQTLVSESRMLDGDSGEAIRWAEQARTLAGELDRSDLLPAILVNEGSALVRLPGREEEGAHLLEMAVAEAEAHGDQLAALRGLYNLATAMVRVWPAARSHRLLDRMADIAERSGRRNWAAEVASLRAWVFTEVEGDAAAARSTLAAPQHDPSLDEGPGARWAAVQEAQLALEASELEWASELAGRVRREAERTGDAERLLWAESLAVQIAARRSQVQASDLAAMVALLGAPEARFVWAWSSDAWFTALHAAVRAGLPASVVRSLRDDPALVALTGSPASDPVWTVHLQGALLESEGQFEEGAGAYGDALAARPQRPPAVVADVWIGLARCLLALQRLDDAREHAEEAVRLLARWPGWRRAEAEALLRRLGGGSEPPGPGVLTPREREVTALLALGLTNAELARRLYISPKTASVHISNILSKLGMTSRTEVAAWAVRTGVAP